MGMRTIRWRNGQSPGRNGQWAERIAHAGSEAVRLVPFSAAAVFPRILRSPALLALRVLLPLLLIQLDRFHHGLSGMAELRDVSLLGLVITGPWSALGTRGYSQYGAPGCVASSPTAVRPAEFVWGCLLKRTWRAFFYHFTSRCR